MNLDLTETQQLLQSTVRDFLTRELPFDRVRELERPESEGRFDERLWRELCAQGWPGLPFSEPRGGADASLVDAGLLVEELARRAAIVPILEVWVAGRALERHASPGTADAWVPGLIDGSVVWVPALFEARGATSTPEAVVDAEGRISGAKTYVDHAQGATHHLVSARGPDGIGLYRVDAVGPGVARRAVRTIGRTPVADVTYRRAPAERVAGEPALAEALQLGRALAALQCVGSMGRALDMTVAYACVREQFGKPIGSFQAVRHHAANMASQLARSRLLAYEALFALEVGRADAAEQVASAKASASRAAPWVLMLAHQIHGGNGVIEENDLYFFTLRGKERSLAWGTGDECLDQLAGSVEVPFEFL